MLNYYINITTIYILICIYIYCGLDTYVYIFIFSLSASHFLNQSPKRLKRKRPPVSRLEYGVKELFYNILKS